MTFIADFRLRKPQRAIALFNLFLGTRQVGNVSQDRDDVGTLAFVGRARTQQLEQQVGSFERIDQQELATGHLRVPDGAGRECRREQHVVQSRCAAPSFARILRGREEFLRVRVGDDQFAFGIGQQDRIGHRVDDAVEQHPLLAKTRLRERLAAH